MAIDFPNSPAVNDTLVVGTTTWKYDGTKWNIVDTVSTSTAFSPIGTVVNYMGSNPPTGWILCDGSSKLRSAYPSLFAIVSTTFGQGSSPGTTFAVPTFVAAIGIFIIRATDDMSVTTASNLLAVPVGTMQQFLSTTNIPTGWLRADGSAYSRTSYADLFALLCTTYTGATTTSSSTTVSGLTGMSAGTHTGWGIAGSGIPSGAYISSVTNSTTVVISANATSTQSGTATLVIGSYGFTGADNTTTFNFPSIAGSGSGSPLYYIKATLSGDMQPSTVAHASNHIRAGTDVIDGDRVQVDYVPSYYTRNSGATGAGATTDLTAHLSGIDNTIFSIRRLDYQQRSTSYTVSTTMTNLATAPEVFGTDLSFTADGTSSYAVECFVPIIWCCANAGYNVWVVLCKGDGTALGTLAQVTGNAYQRLPGGVFKFFYTPAAGTQTLNVRAIQETGGGNGLLDNGASTGYTGSAAPMYLAVYGPQQL